MLHMRAGSLPPLGNQQRPCSCQLHMLGLCRPGQEFDSVHCTLATRLCHLEHIVGKRDPALGRPGRRLDCSLVALPCVPWRAVSFRRPVLPYSSTLGLVKERLRNGSLAVGLQTLLAIL